MPGRGGHKKTLGELKTHLAFDTVPSQDWDANCVWQLLVGLSHNLTHNLIRHFQLSPTATARRKARAAPKPRRSAHRRRSRTFMDNPGKGTLPAGSVEGLIKRQKLTFRWAAGLRASKAGELALDQSLGRLPELDSSHRFSGRPD